MASIKITSKGDFSKTYKMLGKNRAEILRRKLDEYGREGVSALSLATPRRTGRTAEAWSYEIRQGDGLIAIDWTNSNVNRGIHIAVLIQYGHATRGGGYVQGIDYINPAMQPIFKKMADELWKEVTS